MIKLSSIIIAKNEELNIRNCIESQLGVIDEIIVIVDKSSTDRTLEIVRSYDSVICRESEWRGYSATKQYAADIASNDWILWIDADETLTEELKEELSGFKSSSPEHAAYSMPRRAFFLGKWIKHSGWYPGRVTRLFNSKKARFSDKQVHEDLVIEGTTGELKYDLNHFTDPDLFHYYEKFNRYTSLAADELYAKKRRAGLNDLLLRPVFLFVKMYILRRGFLDGKQGFILAVLSSNYVFTKYCKLWEKHNTKKSGK